MLIQGGSKTQNKYATQCFIQEAPQCSELSKENLKITKSARGLYYCTFPATLQTYGHPNRMRRCYDGQNVAQVIAQDERIQTLKRQNKWRGEWNHPNPDIKGDTLTDIRMTIPEPTRTSHMINNDALVGNKYVGTITTHPDTECGRAVNAEIIELGVVPSFSVRLLGIMVPNARPGQPNMRVTKVITFDMVDFPSHPNADAEIPAGVMEQYTSVMFLPELAKYAAQKDEVCKVVCESFEITPEEISGIFQNGDIGITQKNGSFMRMPLQKEIRQEALNFLIRGKK